MSSEEKKDAGAKDSGADVSPAPGGGGKLGVILAFVNILLTVGIGGVVFTQFQKDKHKESVADISSKDEEKPPEGEHGGGEAKKEEGHGEHGGGEHGKEAAKPSGPKVVTLEQFTVNLSTTVGTPPRFARVMIAVEVPTEDTSQELNQKMAQVRNAIIDLFNSKREADLQTGEGRNFLKEEIKNALNSFLLTGKVKGVFFSNFQVSR